MGYRPGDVYHGEFVAHDPTVTPSVLRAADTLPTALLTRNGLDDGSVPMTVALVAGSVSRYAVAGMIPSTYALGDTVTVVISATVAAIPDQEVLDSFLVERTADVLPGAPYRGEFVARDLATGALQPADVLPTALMARNGVDDLAVALTVALVAGTTSRYAVLGLVPAGYARGDTCTVVISATVAAVADQEVLDSFPLGDPAAAPAGTDLISLAEGTAALSETGYTVGQLAYLPAAISAASELVCRECGDRDFLQQQYDRIFPVMLDGTIDLPQIPVLKVSRVSAGRTAALVITQADLSTNQRATVEYECTGDLSPGLGITYTGITLTRTASGVTTAATLLFSLYPTIAGLAAAVGALGAGWSARAIDPFGLKGTAELTNQDDVAQDAFAGAQLMTWGYDLAGASVNKRTGTLDLSGRAASAIDGPRWGPGWESMFDDMRGDLAHCRVIYTAGFVSVPRPIKQATALTVAAMMSSLQTDPRLSSESRGNFSYVVNTAFADYALPKTCLGLISQYILYRT